MRVVKGLETPGFDRKSVVSLGSFDGMHRAHQEILRLLVMRAREIGGRSVVITFEPHPRQVLQPGNADLRFLTDAQEREELCIAAGIDLLVVLEFTYEFSRLPFREFYRRHIIEHIGVARVVEGYDHHFGKDREGGVKELEALGSEFGFEVERLSPFVINGETVSSTVIRRHLEQGELAKANELLGRPYQMTGTVIHGDRRGRTLGFPTANLGGLPKRKLIPSNGIYFSRVLVEGDREYRYGLTSIGIRPTVTASGVRTVETYILDFDADIYDRSMRVELLDRLRNEERFPSVEALIHQMTIDKEHAFRLRDERQNAAQGL